MTAFDTPFTRLFGIEIPVVQAPIGGLSTPALAAAVSNAGGLGMLSVTWRDPDQLRQLLAETLRLTDRPFGVNFVLEWPPDDRLQICLEAGVRLVSFFWGDPAPYVERVHASGALVSYTVGSAEEARRAVAAGVDVIVAQGWEAGGHVWGQVGTLALVPRVVDAATPVPVLAAGGIVDGRGLAAVVALGAAGAWMGTRFLLSEEASVHAHYRQRVAAAVETDTIHTELFDGGWPNAPLRALRNRAVATWEAAGCPESGERPGEGDVVGYNELGEPVPRYSSSAPTDGATGEIEAMVMYAGQGVGLVQRLQPAGEIVREIAEEAARVLDHSQGLVRSEVATGTPEAR
ncbi:MAG: nitronate monooxygenase [Thermomicrobiales bacterium]|jgi:nitronate monooxygenase|nr:nitronate monooxygenase [Thermomicrobiales bacterium]MEA2595498.1 nitronate monooxygenase [Thermomicrobiales bacterium]